MKGAGVVDFRIERPAAITSDGKSETVAADGRGVGFQFTVADQPIVVYQLGRQNVAGKKVGQELAIFKANGEPVGQGRPGIALGDRLFTPGDDEQQRGAWVYRNLTNSNRMTPDSFRPAIYRLEAGQSYVLLGTEAKGNPIPKPSAVQAAKGITIDGAVMDAVSNLNQGKRPLGATIEKLSGTGTAFPHLNCRFSVGVPVGGIRLTPINPQGGPNFPETTPKHKNPDEVLTGSRMAFIAGRGRISQSIDIKEAGEYVLVMTGHSQYELETTFA
jgi:hypothetical protein